MSFSFLQNLLTISQTKDSLETEDIPQLFDSDTCAYIYHQLEYRDHINYYKKFRQHLFHIIADDFYVQFVYQFLASTLWYIPPLCLQRILIYIKDNNSNTSITNTTSTNIDNNAATNAYSTVLAMLSVDTAVLLLFLGPVIQCICNGQNYTRSRRNYFKTKSAFISCLYKKSLYIDLNRVKDGAGALTNLISVDVSEIAEFVAYFHFLWSSALEAFICMFLLVSVLGVSAYFGLIVMCLTVPLGGVGTKYLDIYQKEMLKIKDERMAMINEILAGIRILKVFLLSYLNLI
jgi:ABC-type multidrug transport system fused ATPase/permease subunit